MLLIGLSLLAFDSVNADAESSRPAKLAAQSLLLDVTFAGSRVTAVGERGHILVSDDFGRNWTQVESPVNVLLTAINMYDDKLGFAVGHDAVILRTEDSGDSWQLIHHAPLEERPLLDVWFATAEHGFAIGAYGYFLSTQDGGQTWHSQMISDADFHLNALAADIHPVIYIGAEAGVAYRSADAGENWRELSTPYSGSWFGSLSIPPDSVYLSGLRGSLYRSADGGGLWEEIETGTTATLTGIERSSSGDIFVTGLDGVLLISRDGGQNFTLKQFPDRLGISAAASLPDGNLILVGEFGFRHLDSNELIN